MSHVQISFILPMYNVEKFLDKCVRSLLQQNLPRGTFEIILVNDGSKDNTLAIAQRWASEWPEIKVIDQKNGGLAAARNAGIKMAQGEYLWFIDPDDYILGYSAKKFFEVVMAENLEVLTFEVCRINLGENPKVQFDDSFWPEKSNNGIEFIEKHNYNNSACLFLVQRFFLEKKGLAFKNGFLCEDGMFTMEMLCNASRVSHYASPAYVYIKHPMSITSSYDPAVYKKMLESFAFAIEFFDKFIFAQSQRWDASKGFIKRLKARKDSYVFFFCLRLIKSSQSIRGIVDTHSSLYQKQWLPLKDFSLEEYPGLRYLFLKYIIEHTLTFILAVCIYKFLRIFRRR